MFKDSELVLPKEKVDYYRENGFVQIDNVLTDDETKELSQHLDEVMNYKTERSLQTSAVEGNYYKVLNQRVNTWRDHAGMARFILSTRLAGMADQLIGNKGIRLFHDHALLKMPHDSKETPWHQDYPYWPMKKPGALSIWLTLDDVDEKNGCMKFLPGSQKLKNLQAVSLVDAHDIFKDAKNQGGVLDKSQAVTVPLKKGSCTFHDGLTFHYAYPNYSDQPRRVLAMIYMPVGTVYNGKPHPVTNDAGLQSGASFQSGLFPHLH